MSSLLHVTSPWEQGEQAIERCTRRDSNPHPAKGSLGRRLVYHFATGAPFACIGDVAENARGKLNDTGKRKQDQSKQTRRFIEAARKTECGEDAAAFDEALKQVAKAKPMPAKRNDKRSGY
jgi:hypothetical protein